MTLKTNKVKISLKNGWHIILHFYSDLEKEILKMLFKEKTGKTYDFKNQL